MHGYKVVEVRIDSQVVVSCLSNRGRGGVYEQILFKRLITSWRRVEKSKLSLIPWNETHCFTDTLTTHELNGGFLIDNLW